MIFNLHKESIEEITLNKLEFKVKMLVKFNFLHFGSNKRCSYSLSHLKKYWKSEMAIKVRFGKKNLHFDCNECTKTVAPCTRNTNVNHWKIKYNVWCLFELWWVPFYEHRLSVHRVRFPNPFAAFIDCAFVSHIN